MASMTRGTALVPTVAGVVALTAHQGLANIPEAAEVTLTDVLVSASDAVYDKIQGQGVDPTTLTNAEVYERCVAWHFLSILAETGVFGDDENDGARYMARAEAYCESVVPLTSESTVAANLPQMGNMHKTPLFAKNKFYDKRADLS